MIIRSIAPYRVSFLGGGTDYPPYYLKHSGSVISTTINKYINIFLKPSTHFSRSKYIIKYSKIEMVNEIHQIEHPVVRAVFSYFELTDGVELNIMSDAPAGSGLGSSSVFTVALIGAVLQLKGQPCSNLEIARLAMMVEQKLLSEKVGSQDQYAAAVGGFNHIRFHTDGAIDHSPIYLPQKNSNAFFSNLFLVYTSKTRSANTVTREQNENLTSGSIDVYLNKMKELTKLGKQFLINGDFYEFGLLLNSAWQIKREFASNVSTLEIDELYQLGIQNGALGGKLLGAGNGGFLLFYVPSEKQDAFTKAIMSNKNPYSKVLPDTLGHRVQILV